MVSRWLCSDYLWPRWAFLQMGQEVGGGQWEKFLGKEVPPHFTNLNPVFDGLVPVCFIDGSNNPYYREAGETGDSWQSSEFPHSPSSENPGIQPFTRV